jgi:hypothetical protein
MVDSPANAVERHVRNGPFDSWQRRRPGAGIGAHGAPGTRRRRPDRPRPASKLGRRGVGPRCHPRLHGRDGVGRRARQAERLLPARPRNDLQGRARPVRARRAGRRRLGSRPPRQARRARGGGRPRPAARACEHRPGDRERRPLGAHRAGDGDAARADRDRAADLAARLGARRRDGRSRRSGGTPRLRPLAATRHGRVRTCRGAAEGELRADHRAVRIRRRADRHAVRLPRSRPAHLRVPARQPDHRRRSSVDGKVGARTLHGGEHGRAPQPPRRPVHARDVEVRGDATPDVQRGEGRVAAPP